MGERIIAACGNDCSICTRYIKEPYTKTESECSYGIPSHLNLFTVKYVVKKNTRLCVKPFLKRKRIWL